MKNFKARHPRLPRPIVAGLFASLLCCSPATQGQAQILKGAIAAADADARAGAPNSFQGRASPSSRLVMSGAMSVANVARLLLRAAQQRRRWWRRATQNGSHESIHAPPMPGGKAWGKPVRLPVHWVDPPCSFRISPRNRRASLRV